MTCTVYLLTNTHNGKVYVGVTNNLARRIAVHKHYAKRTDKKAPCSLLARATRKYGWSKFQLDILAETSNPNEAWGVLEPRYIAEYLANDPAHGYNLTRGGEGTPGMKMSPLSRRRMSEHHWSKRGFTHGMLGRRHTASARYATGSKHAIYLWTCISPDGERYTTDTFGMFIETHKLNFDAAVKFLGMTVPPPRNAGVVITETRHNTTGWHFTRVPKVSS